MKNKKHLFIFPLLLLGIVLFMQSSCKKDAANNQPAVTNLSGTWGIVGTLVTTNNQAAGAPQPGFQAVDSWVVSLNGTVPVLTTSKGTVNGSGVGNGYHFEGMVTILAGVAYMTFIIEIFPSVEYNHIYGTEQFNYFGIDGLGTPHPTGSESWTVAGIKQ